MTIFAAVSLLGVLAGPSPAERLEVVAPRAFHGALTAYVRHRERDLPVDLVALEEILEKGAGRDDPEKVKRHLYDGYRERGVRYALLVGDADVFPVRYMVLDRVTPEAFDFAFYPSDLYYADLAKRPGGAFEDWNGRRDGFHEGYFGEVRGEKWKDGPINADGIDYVPEIAVGRWPVSRPEEAAVVAAKTIAFETDPPARTAAALCVDGWIDARGALDAAIGKLPRGWSAERRYYFAAGEGERTPPPSEESAVELVNSGVALLVHAGHGFDHGWDRSLTVNALPRFTRAAIFFSIGCSTARFATLPPYEAYVDVAGAAHAGTNSKEVFTAPPPPPACYAIGPHNPPGLGERLVREGASSGAVAYIGCNTGGQPCAMTLLDGFFTALGEAEGTVPPRLGDLYARALTLYYERENLATLAPDEGWYPPSIFFQGMKYMLFGDPTLKLPAGGGASGARPR